VLTRARAQALYESLMERNLSRLIEPFSRVEIAHVAALIQLPVETVERKLSQMILDKLFQGTLDQGAGCLVVYEGGGEDPCYVSALATFASLDKVVDSLAAKSAKIRAL